jgi:hypothetical protein
MAAEAPMDMELLAKNWLALANRGIAAITLGVLTPRLKRSFGEG